MLRMIRDLAVAVSVMAGLMGSAQAAIQNELKRDFQVGPGGTLTVDADLGDIDIRTGGTGVSIDLVRIAHTSSRSKADALFRKTSVQASATGNDVTFTLKREPNLGFFHITFGNDLDARIVVTIPARYSVHLATSGGNIHIGDLHGTVVAKSSGGDVKLERIDGTVNARTSGGNVAIAASTGKTDLYTSGGDIRVGDTASVLDAHTSGGSIHVLRAGTDATLYTSGGNIEIDDAAGTIDAHTSGGSINAKLSHPLRGNSKLSTSGGSVRVDIAANVGLNLDAHTSGGDVESDLPVTVQGKQTDSSLVGKVNGGGPSLVLRSSGGDVRLRKI